MIVWRFARLPPSGAQSVACGVIACLFKMRIFSLSKLKILMAYCDSSGFGGIRREKLALFRVYMETSAGIDIDKITENDAEMLYRYFLFEDASDGRVLCLIDMGTGRIALPDGGSLSLAEEYGGSGRDMDVLACRVSRRIGL